MTHAGLTLDWKSPGIITGEESPKKEGIAMAGKKKHRKHSLRSTAVHTVFFALVLLGAQLHAAVPDAPAAAFARAGDGLVVASWLAPIAQSATPIESYTASVEPGGQQCQTSGDPLWMTCTISGLDNDTAYTVSVVAQNAAGASNPSPDSAAVTPVAGTEAINLIGTHGRVRWNEGFVGRKDAGVAESFPTGIYNSGVYSGSIDEIFTAAEVNDNFSSLADCTSSWRFVQILCDPEAPDGDPGRNTPDLLWKHNNHAGITFNNTSNRSGFVVIDLEEPRDFTTLRLFQMFSDGKVTDVRMSTSSQTGEEWPAVDDGSWSEVVPRSTVGAGNGSSLNNSYVSCPSIYDFGPRSARYLKLEMWNSGEFGSGSYIEASAAKLFFESEPTDSADGCPLEPPTNLTAFPRLSDAILLWTPPAASIDSYEVQQSTDGGENWVTLSLPLESLEGDVVRLTIPDLVEGTEYQFRLRVSNEDGASRFSLPSNTITQLDLIYRDRFESAGQ